MEYTAELVLRRQIYFWINTFMELIKYYTQYYIANAGCALLCVENVYKVLVQVIEKSLFFLWIYI